MTKFKNWRERSAVAVVLPVLVATGLAACGSSSHKTSAPKATPASTATAPAGASNATAAKGTPIVVGTICSCSGPTASLEAKQGRVSQVWAKTVNAAGGINGHPVQMIVKDDGNNAATALQDAKALVQDHVIAIVGDNSEQDGSWASYIAQQGIPVVGGQNVTGPYLTSPDFFPSGTQLPLATASIVSLAKQAGRKHFALVYCAELPVCAQLVPLAQNPAKAQGMAFSTAKVSATAPSDAAPCLQLRSEGVDSIYVADAPPVVEKFIDDCAQQGYTPQNVNNIASASNSWLSDSRLGGTLLVGTNANPFDTSTPAVQTFYAALNKYAPGLTKSQQFSYPDLFAWTGGLLFQAAAKAGNIGPSSTPADVKKGLYALKNETLGGLAPPLNFTPGKPSLVPCYFTDKMEGGKFVSLNGNKPTCVSAAQIKTLLG